MDQGIIEDLRCDLLPSNQKKKGAILLAAPVPTGMFFPSPPFDLTLSKKIILKILEQINKIIIFATIY